MKMLDEIKTLMSVGEIVKADVALKNCWRRSRATVKWMMTLSTMNWHEIC